MKAGSKVICRTTEVWEFLPGVCDRFLPSLRVSSTFRTHCWDVNYVLFFCK